MESLRKCLGQQDMTLNKVVPARKEGMFANQGQEVEARLGVPKKVFFKIMKNCLTGDWWDSNTHYNQKTMALRIRELGTYQQVCVRWYHLFNEELCKNKIDSLSPAIQDIYRMYFSQMSLHNFFACLNETVIDKRLLLWGQEVPFLGNRKVERQTFLWEYHDVPKINPSIADAVVDLVRGGLYLYGMWKDYSKYWKICKRDIQIVTEKFGVKQIG